MMQMLFMCSHNWLLKFWAALSRQGWVCTSLLLPKCLHAPNHQVLTSDNRASCYCLANIDNAPRAWPTTHSYINSHLRTDLMGQGTFQRLTSSILANRPKSPGKINHCKLLFVQHTSIEFTKYVDLVGTVGTKSSITTLQQHPIERNANAPRQLQWASYQEPRNPHDQGKCPSEGKPKCWFQSSTWVHRESTSNKLRSHKYTLYYST